jgi:two-component SAPR family response regulator
MDKKKILLVDDDDISNILNKMIINIADPHINLIIYNNASDALGYLQDNQNELPDCILLDINMPVMNGWQFAQKCLEVFPSIRIAILSSSDNSDDLDKINAYNNIIQYIIKPMSIENFNKLIHS